MTSPFGTPPSGDPSGSLPPPPPSGPTPGGPPPPPPSPSRPITEEVPVTPGPASSPPRLGDLGTDSPWSDGRGGRGSTQVVDEPLRSWSPPNPLEPADKPTEPSDASPPWWVIAAIVGGAVIACYVVWLLTNSWLRNAYSDGRGYWVPAVALAVAGGLWGLLMGGTGALQRAGLGALAGAVAGVVGSFLLGSSETHLNAMDDTMLSGGSLLRALGWGAFTAAAWAATLGAATVRQRMTQVGTGAAIGGFATGATMGLLAGTNLFGTRVVPTDLWWSLPIRDADAEVSVLPLLLLAVGVPVTVAALNRRSVAIAGRPLLVGALASLLVPVVGGAAGYTSDLDGARRDGTFTGAAPDPDVTTPTIPVPDISLPDISLPDIVLPTLPDSQVPESSLPDVSSPDLVVPTLADSTVGDSAATSEASDASDPTVATAADSSVSSSSDPAEPTDDTAGTTTTVTTAAGGSTSAPGTTTAGSTVDTTTDSAADSTADTASGSDPATPGDTVAVPFDAGFPFAVAYNGTATNDNGQTAEVLIAVGQAAPLEDADEIWNGPSTCATEGAAVIPFVIQVTTTDPAVTYVDVRFSQGAVVDAETVTSHPMTIEFHDPDGTTRCASATAADTSNTPAFTALPSQTPAALGYAYGYFVIADFFTGDQTAAESAAAVTVVPIVNQVVTATDVTIDGVAPIDVTDPATGDTVPALDLVP